MRKRIQQFARGKFEYAGPVLSFSEEKIELEVLEGKDVSGSFTVSSDTQAPIRGVVYSSNPRMKCLTSQFESGEVRIRYEFHSDGLIEGDVQKGDFTIVCNKVEYSLSFCVSITRLYADSSIGRIKTLYDFTSLAQKDWQEAYKLFYSRGFENVIKEKEIQEAMIYRGLMQARPSDRNMEEFLVGIRKKQPIHFEIEERTYRFADVEENRMEVIPIHKDQWGYVEIEITSDAEFLQLSKERLTTEDFLGSSCNYEYFLDFAHLHAGKNFGRLTFSNAFQRIDVEIIVNCKREAAKNQTKPDRMRIKESKVGMMELYQAYRLKKIVTGVWANESVEILDHLHALEPQEPMYLLMKAQVLVINRQRQEAEWILSAFRREWEDRRAPIWGYYLYIMTLMEREPVYVDKMTHEIEGIFHENPDSVLLFWVLSFLQEEYFNNNAHKLKAIEYWVTKGCSSPYLYLEAYYLIWQDAYLLTKLENFEIRVLRWAIHYRAVTKDIAAQIFQIAGSMREFSEPVYKLLCAAYEADPKPENIGMICSYLIKGQQFDHKYHDWYEQGIKLELRITSLYEAYLMSMDNRSVAPVPKIIQMYFRYESSIPYKKMAVLYNNIIAAKHTEREVYQKYQRTMGRFAMEQAEAEHMDDNLAVLYEDMLDVGLVNKELAHSLASILFTHKLIIFGADLVRAIIFQRQTKEPQIVPIKNHTAYFQLFSNEFVIMFEDSRGMRYTSSISYQLQKLMKPSRYIHKCMELAPAELPYIIYHFDKKQSYLTFTEEDRNFFPRILYAEDLNPEYQGEMVPEILRYYESVSKPEQVEEYLEYIDIDSLSQSARKYVLELFVEYHMYEKAYAGIEVYGIDQISAAAKVALACYRIKQIDSEEDELLLDLCALAFAGKKYNALILDYLCRYYNGPTGFMQDIWKAASEFEVNTFEIEERILVQTMYGDSYLEYADAVFESYYNNGGRELVVLAYLSAAAYGYFVKSQVTGSYVFQMIEARFANAMELNDACKLALLSYYSDTETLTDEQFAIADALLSEYTNRNMYFAFYKKLDERLLLKFQLYDRVCLEYRTNPKNHVILHYSRDEDGENFISEDMTDVYGGIFVKQLILFFGETVQYYISEEAGNQVEVTESNRITKNDIYNETNHSRYNLLNQMLISNTLKETDSLHQNMREYAQLAETTRKAFHLL